MFDDALSAFISVLDQHTLAELATQKSPLGLSNADRESDGASGRGAKARAKKPAVRRS
jgi:Rrf2 family nitric oxide-sensitive transcriptional repressor